MNSRIITTYTGFYGQQATTSSGFPTPVSWKLGSPGPSFAGQDGAIQWLNPACDEGYLLTPTPLGQVLLAGLVQYHGNVPLEHHLADLLTSGRYSELSTLVENSAGCFMSKANTLYLWVGFASEDVVFVRVQEDVKRTLWSTNPLDLVRSQEDVDMWAMRRCCHGDDAFVYDEEKVRRVEQGHLLTLQFDERGGVRMKDVQFDRFLPDQRLLSQTITQETVVRQTREALLNAVRPLADEERVGIMVSGGVGSIALLHAMKQVGVNVIAYHIDASIPEASEYRFAQMACSALDVPLTRIPMRCGPDYLSASWKFSHPDGHPWVRWFEQLAQQARRDGVALLVTGAGDDHAFGPETEYGLHAIFRANISWREKKAMARGIFSTDWNIVDILRSMWPWPAHQLIGLTFLSGPSKEDSHMRRADFLTPVPFRPRERDAALFHSPCFAPQCMAIEHTIVQPNGIRLFYPYHTREVQALSLALPVPYRLLPRASLPPDVARFVPASQRIVTKPILRLACHNTPLPPEAVWRTWPVYTLAPIQAFCLTQTALLADILGEDSWLARMGIVDSSRLQRVLESPTRIRENYTSLVASALVELFARNALSVQCQGGGPSWQ